MPSMDSAMGYPNPCVSRLLLSRMSADDTLIHSSDDSTAITSLRGTTPAVRQNVLSTAEEDSGLGIDQTDPAASSIT